MASSAISLSSAVSPASTLLQKVRSHRGLQTRRLLDKMVYAIIVMNTDGTDERRHVREVGTLSVDAVPRVPSLRHQRFAVTRTAEHLKQLRELPSEDRDRTEGLWSLQRWQDA